MWLAAPEACETDPVNIGNATEFTIVELADAVLDLVGSEAGIRHLPLPEDDPKVRQPDISRASDVLGWQAEVPLREGLEKTIAYFRRLHETRKLTVPPVLTEDEE